MKASLDVNQPLPKNGVQTSGISDGFIALETTLIGNDAMNVLAFAKAQPKFNLNGIFKFWFSGTYDSDKLINLGSNRMTFEAGLPMAIPLSKNTSRMTWLETWPGIQFFTANNDPAKLTGADKITQKPLFYLENHLSHSFTPKLYAGVDVRIQQGGQTLSDDVEDDNRISLLGGGIFAGYKILPYLDFYANYGTILAGQNNAKSNMIRLSLTFSYANTKKLQPAQ
jgi:hypothetical protein